MLGWSGKLHVSFHFNVYRQQYIYRFDARSLSWARVKTCCYSRDPSQLSYSERRKEKKKLDWYDAVAAKPSVEHMEFVSIVSGLLSDRAFTATLLVSRCYLRPTENFSEPLSRLSLSGSTEES